MINLIFPVFEAADGALASFLPPIARICFWGAAAGALSLLIYALLSPQGRIARYKEELREYRRELFANKDIDFSEYMAVSRKNLKVSMLFLANAIGPAIVSALPVILILVWVHSAVGYSVPDKLNVKAHPPGPALTLARTPEGVAVHDGDTVIYRGNPLDPPVPSVYGRRWWNLIHENPAGYLNDTTDLDRIEFNMKKNRYLTFMPGWGEGFELPYFLFVFIIALSGRLIFRIN